MYFEKQGNMSSLCCVHAINNLLGICAFREKDFNKICNQLAQFQQQLDPENYKWGLNPHKHLFGGDFDANVLISAFQKISFKCQWIDKRVIFDIRQRQKPIIGYILNIQKQKKFYHSLLNLSNRHWIALKSYEGQFYILDSEKNKQQKIDDINAYINSQLSKGNSVIQVKRSNKIANK